MAMASVENKGRVLIPKAIRDRLSLKGGEKLRIDLYHDKIVMIPIKDKIQLKQLKGCIQKSKINPLELKRIWGG